MQRPHAYSILGGFHGMAGEPFRRAGGAMLRAGSGSDTLAIFARNFRSTFRRLAFAVCNQLLRWMVATALRLRRVGRDRPPWKLRRAEQDDTAESVEALRRVLSCARGHGTSPDMRHDRLGGS